MPSKTAFAFGLVICAIHVALFPRASVIGCPKLFVGRLKNGTSDVGSGPVVGLPGITQAEGTADASGNWPAETVFAGAVKSFSIGLVKLSVFLCGLVIVNC